MKIKVRYFGMIAEQIGIQEEWLEWEQPPSDLHAFFLEKYPSLQNKSFQTAVNHEITDRLDASLEIAEIALLPPFAGG